VIQGMTRYQFRASQVSTVLSLTHLGTQGFDAQASIGNRGL
jgi:hypothetical protein